MTKVSPLTLSWVPCYDAWQADACTIRGVDLYEVMSQLRDTAAMKAVFGN